jgi:S-adenosylmethionine:tRNA ribosyltransferase-isomerase
MPDPAAPTYRLADFDYALPPELVAQAPPAERSGSRLLDGRGEWPVDRAFRDLPGLLRAGDLLVFNDTRVLKARLHGRKASGGAVEALVERVLPGHEVLAQLRASKPLRTGGSVRFADAFDAEVVGRGGADGSLFRLRLPDEPHALLERHGHVPLPPYIARPDSAQDEARYQSIFARAPGAVAAPTASLHFDEALLAALRAAGLATTTVTLHVGAGTFQPVRHDDLSLHRMHAEWYRIGDEAVAAVAAARRQGGRVVAVGTTVLRALESAARDGELRAGTAETELFITPGFEFCVADLLLTNFHLPRSTLLMLVSAFAGHEHVRALYRHAVEARYRFFSYGDAMLLERR